MHRTKGKVVDIPARLQSQDSNHQSSEAGSESEGVLGSASGRHDCRWGGGGGEVSCCGLGDGEGSCWDGDGGVDLGWGCRGWVAGWGAGNEISGDG